MARGSRYCSIDGGDDHVCESGLYRTLARLSVEGDRTALRILVSHPSKKVVDLCFGLLDREDVPGPRVDAGAALCKLTGGRLKVPRSELWRKELDRLGDAVQDELRKEAARQQGRVRRAHDQAVGRLEALRARR